MGETLAAESAFLSINASCIECHTIGLGDFIIHHDSLFRALRDAQPALETFLVIYLVSHFSAPSLQTSSLPV